MDGEGLEGAHVLVCVYAAEEDAACAGVEVVEPDGVGGRGDEVFCDHSRGQVVVGFFACAANLHFVYGVADSEDAFVG